MGKDVFMSKMREPEMHAYLRALNLAAGEANLSDLFETIDTDRSGALDADELVDACMKLTGPLKALCFEFFVQQLSCRLQQIVILQSDILESTQRRTEGESEKEKPPRQRTVVEPLGAFTTKGATTLCDV